MPNLNEYFEGFVTGEAAVGAVAAPLSATSVRTRLVFVKALGTNTGKVYVGTAGVTTTSGITDQTTGYELSAGESMPPLPVPDLTAISLVASAAGQGVTYMAYVS